jgi:hypothetical protein
MELFVVPKSMPIAPVLVWEVECRMQDRLIRKLETPQVFLGSCKVTTQRISHEVFYCATLPGLLSAGSISGQATQADSLIIQRIGIEWRNIELS